MNFNVFHEHFCESKLLCNADMSEYTSFKVGGAADLMIMPSSACDIKQAISLCKSNSIPCFIMGKGSNVLVKDSGFRGVIISLSKGFEKIEQIDDCVIKAEAGVSLAKLAAFAADVSLAGLEFASGIPGSLGGALYMNAGAYDYDMSGVVLSAALVDENANEKVMQAAEMALGYRTSVFHNAKYVIASCTLKLQPGDKEAIKAKMLELNNRRKVSQPLELPSAGSTFKRPQGYYAAKLIDDAGLKGFSIGGAMVSEKHAGFIVNFNNATASDILALMEHVKRDVYEKFGVILVPEVEVLGE